MQVSGLQNKVAVVTGGGGAIGGATALTLAAQGAHVVVADYDAGRAQDCAARIRQAGGSAISCDTNIGDLASINSMFATAVDAFGGVDILHNNAAASDLAHKDGQVADLDIGVWNTTLQIDLTGAFLCSRVAIPLLVHRGGGSIIMTASVEALHGDVTVSAYSAAKAGLLSLTSSIATQYGRDGVRCNSICPGLIPSHRTSESTRLSFARHQLVSRDGAPQDVANLVTYLASDEGSWITGQAIAVDGGLTCPSPTAADSRDQLFLSDTELDVATQSGSSEAVDDEFK